MIDKIKLKNLGADLNSNKVTSESSPKRVSDAKVSKVSHPSKDVESNYGKVSQFISKEKIKSMSKEPPIDKASTTRIKEAIKNGNYPVDLAKVADALFDAYKEMK